MKIKTRLHASQLYLPKDFLEKLALDKESEVILELDEENKCLLIQSEQNAVEENPAKWILNAMANLPSGVGSFNEDQKEYDFDDI